MGRPLHSDKAVLHPSLDVLSRFGIAQGRRILQVYPAPTT